LSSDEDDDELLSDVDYVENHLLSAQEDENLAGFMKKGVHLVVFVHGMDGKCMEK
jgi:hypothetical protein